MKRAKIFLMLTVLFTLAALALTLTACDKKCEHIYFDTVTTEPGCESEGVKAYVCTFCGDNYTESIAALGHAEVSHEAKAPTCTEKGYDAYVTCSRCDYTTYNEKAALNHDEQAHEAKAPTCTEIGWDAYVTCSRCDYTTYKEKAALNHDEQTHDHRDFGDS